MDLGDILSNYTYVFILIMARYIGLFLLAPILGSRVIPVRVRIALIYFLAVLTLPLLSNLQAIALPINPVIIGLGVISELAVGFTIGFISFLVFAVIQLAGQFIDMRMGFAIVNVMDPITGMSAPLMGQFKNVLAILLFLTINGHHLLIKTLYQSYNLIELGGAAFSRSTFQYIFQTTADIFMLAFQLALPVIGTLFIADVIFGFLARSIPQMNIFIVGLPMKILIGLLVLILSIHFTVYFFQDLFSSMYQQLYQLIKLLG